MFLILLEDLLLQHPSNVSKFSYFLLFGDLHLSTALNLSMFVGGHASVGARVGLRHFADLHLGVLAFVVDGDTATRGDLPPFTLHPLHIRDGLASNLGNKSCSSLFKRRRSTIRLKKTL